jgi:PAS domain S-box-containing protein
MPDRQNTRKADIVSSKPSYEELARRVRLLEEEAAKRVEIENALRESEKKLRIFIENTPAPVAICDSQMRYLAHSHRWISDYRLDGDDLIGRSHYDVFKTIPAKWKEEHRRCFSGEIIESEDEPFPRSDGSLDWVRRKIVPWRRPGGDIGGLIMFTEVITAQKIAQNSLLESEEKYRKLVDNATEAIFIVQDESIKFPNPRALEILGFEAEDFRPLPYESVIDPEDRERILDVHRRRLAGEENLPTSISLGMFNSRGQEYIVDLSEVVITWEGRPATLNFVRDITEQKKLETGLRLAQKMEAVGNLAGGIAHDFNNLLLGIQGSTSLMLMDVDPTHPHFGHMKNIEECIRRTTQLTRQLLGYARGGKYEVEPINLNLIIRHIAEMFARTKKEIWINNNFEDQIWTVEADRGQIEQVMLNLLVNAAQAMPMGGNIYLKTENAEMTDSLASRHGVAAGRYVMISVKDTGCGMDETVRNRVFEPFFTTKERGEGTGLGLASTYGIIRNHGGVITCDSIKGLGTTFTIFLPASTKNAVENRPAPQTVFSGEGTVLLVDDESMMVAIGRKMLEKLGYRVLTAVSGKTAIDLFTRHHSRIALVILDLIMPGLSGSDTFDKLKKIDPSVKVLLSSGYSAEGPTRKVLARGCAGFLQKPFDLQILSKKIRAVLDCSA